MYKYDQEKRTFTYRQNNIEINFWSPNNQKKLSVGVINYEDPKPHLLLEENSGIFMCTESESVSVFSVYQLDN